MFHIRACLLFTIVVAVESVDSSSAFRIGSQGRVMWQDDCDLYGNDIKSIRGIPEICGDQCVGNSECTHWSWTHFDGGTCWLKSGKSATVSMLRGSNCGYVIDRFTCSDSITTGKQSTEQNAVEKTYTSGQVTPGSGLTWHSWSSFSNFGSQNIAPKTGFTFEAPAPPSFQTEQTDPTPKTPAPPSFQTEQTDQTPEAPAYPTSQTEQTDLTPQTSSDNGLTSAQSSEMLGSLNSYRAQNGLAALTIDSQLTAAALVHSKDQASQCAMSHDGSDGSKPWDRIKAAGYDWSVVAENVAAGQASVQEVMTAWWNSPGHRENILKNDVTNVGFAFVSTTSCSEFKTYWTQEFGAR
ncbi:putative PAN/Apple domain, CAP domain, CAP superfamily protein [Plasmopara halstedii]